MRCPQHFCPATTARGPPKFGHNSAWPSIRFFWPQHSVALQYHWSPSIRFFRRRARVGFQKKVGATLVVARSADRRNEL